MSENKQPWYYRPAEAVTDDVNTPIRADLCIYGGTAAGVVAAVQAARMGLNTVLLEFGEHLGGMTSSGLGMTDVGREKAIGGLARSFYEDVARHYQGAQDPTGEGVMWTFEPHVAEQIFNDWIQQARVAVYFNQHLASVDMSQGRIRSITMEDGRRCEATVFIDATYEGDLMAKAGVSYRVGREDNSEYRETLNGISFGSPHHNFRAWVDPYVIEGKPDSGLVAGVVDEKPGYQGQGDNSVQAYCFRICLTDDPERRMALPEPPGYNPDRYVLLARYIRAGVWDALRKLSCRLPNGKVDLNNFGAVSTDHIGFSHEWPEADYARRELIYQDHVNYNMGLLYFLAHDEQVPAHIRESVQKWGLPIDEFVTTGGWPHQLYIREGRRMVSDVVMTEQHCRSLRRVPDSVGLASYPMDSHNCRRIVIDGRAINEGNVEISVPAPYAVSYRSIVPKGEECTNLLVPVCVSASHIAYGSIRMEPVFMILGQSAATAAALAIEHGRAVQEIEYADLRARLLEDGQVLDP